MKVFDIQTKNKNYEKIDDRFGNVGDGCGRYHVGNHQHE